MEYATLYYPKFEPEQSWLRPVLLFFDKVQRIIPAQAQHTDSRAMHDLTRVMPNAVETVEPTEDDKFFDDINFSRLEKAFLEIKTRNQGRPTKSFQFKRQNNLLAMEGDVWLSNAKLHERVKRLLLNYNLANEFPASLNPFGDTFPANEEASNLIVSYVADRMAKRKGLDTITDTPLPHALQSLNAMLPTPASVAREGEGFLAAAVATASVPRNITALDIHTFQELRESFKDIRPAFHELTRSLAAYSRLHRQQSVGALESRIEQAIAGYLRQFETYKKTAFARRFDAWVAISFQGLLGVLGVIGPTEFQALMATGMVAVEVVKQKIANETPHTPHDNLFRMLCKLEKQVGETEMVANLV